MLPGPTRRSGCQKKKAAGTSLRPKWQPTDRLFSVRSQSQAEEMNNGQAAGVTSQEVARTSGGATATCDLREMSIMTDNRHSACAYVGESAHTCDDTSKAEDGRVTGPIHGARFFLGVFFVTSLLIPLILILQWLFLKWYVERTWLATGLEVTAVQHIKCKETLL